MDTFEQKTAHESAEAVIVTATAHAEAVELSRVDQLAALLASPELARTLEDAVVSALGRGASEKRYIDVNRIPFICDDIRLIKESLDEVKENLSDFPTIKSLVFGFAALILVGTVTFIGILVLHYLHLS